jgi:hypothetical protein
MRPLWERLPDEPAHWHDRFEVYRLLGPTRTLSGAYRFHCQADGSSVRHLPGAWRRAAAQWQWSRRAAAWDSAQPARPAQARPAPSTPRAAAPAPLRRGRLVEELLAAVMAALRQADLQSMARDEARAALPTLRGLFRDLLTAHRVEADRAAGLPVDQPPLTADDLRRAHQELEAWEQEERLTAETQRTLRPD